MDSAALYSKLRAARHGDLSQLRPPHGPLARLATVQGFDTLLWSKLCQSNTHRELTNRLEEQVMLEVARAGLRQQTARDICERFAASGIRCVLLKGSAFAYTLYEKPWHRPSADVDVLVSAADAQGAYELLRSSHTPAVQMTGRLVSYQQSFSDPAQPLAPDIDLHWRLSNTQLFAHSYEFEELWAERIPLPEISSSAFGLSDTHALLHACMHRAGHRRAPLYFEGQSLPAVDRLIWLEDIERLWIRLATDARFVVGPEAQARGIAAVVLDAISAALQDTPAEGANRHFGLMRADLEPDRSAVLLSGNPLRGFMSDLAALSTWADRIQLIRDHTLPDRNYMAARYRTQSTTELLLAYARRLLGGLMKQARASVRL